MNLIFHIQKIFDVTIISKTIVLIITFNTMAFTWQITACPIFNSSGNRVEELSDHLFQLLQLKDRCPQNVIEFRQLLKNEGADIITTMVANRGFHNPQQGSFSFFEMAEISNPLHLFMPVQKDELFFGHFTTAGTNNSLTLDQDPFNSSLMIELISWDKKNEMYNFYELIGSNQGSQWFYRGSSADIWADTSKLHRTRAQGEAIFGKQLRCSGCHISGGPIMKELAEPHDSWWRTTRPLPLGVKKPDMLVQEIMNNLQSPNALRESTISGLKKLMSGVAFKNKQNKSPQIALRPLFCPEEINLEATPWTLNRNTNEIIAPPNFFNDERFDVQTTTRAPKDFYIKALQTVNSRFPETKFLDGDHAWNSPVKATADILSIENLISQGTIDQEFVLDILAIDITRPVFSKKRCSLLKLIPMNWSSDWQKNFQINLKQSVLPEASELLANLTDNKRTKEFHRDRAQRFLENCKSQLEIQEGVTNLVRYLGQIRTEIKESEVSQNPQGQILEPGFRVIFPVFHPAPKPGKITLNDACKI